MNIPWPIVQDAVLIAAGVQLALAAGGHFIGFTGRHLVLAIAAVGLPASAPLDHHLSAHTTRGNPGDGSPVPKTCPHLKQ